MIFEQQNQKIFLEKNLKNWEKQILGKKIFEKIFLKNFYQKFLSQILFFPNIFLKKKKNEKIYFILYIQLEPYFGSSSSLAALICGWLSC